MGGPWSTNRVSLMPPFAGAAEEAEAIVQWRTRGRAERPGVWPVSADPDMFAPIQQDLDEAGTGPGVRVEGGSVRCQQALSTGY